jgi:hypothetical protein
MEGMIEYILTIGLSAHRRIRLFATNCYRLAPIAEYSEMDLALFNAYEQCIEGLISPRELKTIIRTLHDPWKHFDLSVLDSTIPPHPVPDHMAWWERFREHLVDQIHSQHDAPIDVTRERIASLFVNLLHDIFGNPFRPVTLDPRWLSSTVIDVARTIYDERVFERMPILADALMDAGCDSEQILNHCHGPGPHVRGCWVVDLILSKN